MGNDIDVNGIKLLRKSTGAGMLDCRKALAQAGGDAAAAEALLKEWGLAGVEKRSERATNEGRIFVRAASSRVAMVEIACETDFVARNELFLETGARIASHACENGLRAPDAEAQSQIAGIAGVFKENLSLGRMAFMEAGEGERIADYVHGDGRIGVLVRARADSGAAFGDERVSSFLHDLALHVAAFKPLFLAEGAVPDSYKAEMAEDFRRQIEEDGKARGKSAAILEGIASGKMRKHLAEVCLLGHGFVREEKLPVSEAIRALAEETGHSLEVLDFEYLKIGE